MIRNSLLLIFSLLVNFAYSQKKYFVKNFEFNYQVLNDQDKIRLSVKNTSSKNKLNYSIGFSVLSDTGWVVVLSDIYSLGKNDFLYLKPIKPKQKITTIISRKYIFSVYPRFNSKKIKFNLLCYEKQDLKSKGAIIELFPKF